MSARRVSVLEALLGYVEVLFGLLQPGCGSIALLLDAEDRLSQVSRHAVCLAGRRDRSGAAGWAPATGGAPVRFRLRDPLCPAALVRAGSCSYFQSASRRIKAPLNQIAQGRATSPYK